MPGNRHTREPCPNCGSEWTYWNNNELVCRKCGAITPLSTFRSPEYTMNKQFI